MKKLTAALAFAAALTLSACSTPETAPQVLQSETAPAASATAAPIPTEAAAPTSEAVEGEIDFAYYVKGVRASWVDATATDEQIIAAGKLACEQMRDGAQAYEVAVVDGSEAGSKSNLTIASAAMSVICTDADPLAG